MGICCVCELARLEARIEVCLETQKAPVAFLWCDEISHHERTWLRTREG